MTDLVMRGPLPQVGDVIGGIRLTDEVAGAMFNSIHCGPVRDTATRALLTAAAGAPRSIDDLRTRLDYAVPGIAECFAIDSFAGPAGTISTLAEGRPQGRSLAELAPMPERTAIEVLLEVANVADAAHRKGLTLVGIHPLLTYAIDSDAGPRFSGIAPRALPFLLALPPTRGGLCLQDVYAPAEVWNRGSVAAAADVFSMCALGLFLLTGSHPYPADGDPNAALARALRGDPPAVGHASLDPVLQRGLDRDPAKRISLDELRALLSAAVR